ncbi:hypothetical protein EI030_24600, partial [Escherichia coli]|nr:hypothetical protein [Escherichia coli]
AGYWFLQLLDRVTRLAP